MTASAARPAAAEPVAPWWRFPMVWLVISGPALVVVAGLVTAVIAVRGADIVVTDMPAAQQAARTGAADAPAVQARNHAATAAR